MGNRLRQDTYGRAAIAVVFAIMVSLAYVISPLRMFWEHEDEPHVYSISWHSGLVFLILITFSYLVIWFVLRKR